MGEDGGRPDGLGVLLVNLRVADQVLHLLQEALRILRGHGGDGGRALLLQLLELLLLIGGGPGRPRLQGGVPGADLYPWLPLRR